MEKVESIEALAKKYTEIFRDEYGFAQTWIGDVRMTDFLIEFAGAVEHRLSSERAVEADAENIAVCSDCNFEYGSTACCGCPNDPYYST